MADRDFLQPPCVKFYWANQKPELRPRVLKLPSNKCGTWCPFWGSVMLTPTWGAERTERLNVLASAMTLWNTIMIADAESDGSNAEAEEANRSAIVLGHPRRLSVSHSRTPEGFCLRLLLVRLRESHCRHQRNPHKCTRNVLRAAGVDR